MRAFILLYIILFCGKLLFASECHWDSIDRIVILYSDWDLLTDIPISGPEFHHIAKKEFSIAETETISAFKSEMENLYPVEDTNINVRCKVFFYSGNHIKETFCITTRSVLFRGYTYELTQGLLSLINGIVSNNCYLEPSAEEFPIYNNYATVSPDLLRNKLSQHIEDTEILGSTKVQEIIAVCKVDILGNTIDASIYCKPKLESDYIKESLRLFFIENLKWTENPERNISDKYY